MYCEIGDPGDSLVWFSGSVNSAESQDQVMIRIDQGEGESQKLYAASGS